MLGRGACKTVYKGFDEQEGIEIAWNKIAVAELGKARGDAEQVHNEVDLLEGLKHKSIMKCYGSWVDEATGNVNFFTEMFTSGTLRQYRKKHKHLKQEVLQRWMRQILRGLLYLHGHDPPIIHRDLKCDNIFVNGASGELKIGDLGMATALLTAQKASSVLGTPEYMAPELYEEDYDERVDIYSFGMCILEMITYDFPYCECENAAQIYKKVCAGVKPQGLEKVKDPQLRELVELCLSGKDDRPSARELLDHPFLAKKAPEDLIMGPKSASPDAGEGGKLPQTATPPHPHLRRTSTPPHPLLRRTATPPHPTAAADLRDAVADGMERVGAELRRTLTPDPSLIQEVLGSLLGDQHYQNGAAYHSDDNGAADPRGSGGFQVKVKGKKVEGDLVLKLRIVDAEGGSRKVEFKYDVEADSAESVAREMVDVLNLAPEDAGLIAAKIDNEVENILGDLAEEHTTIKQDLISAAPPSDYTEAALRSHQGMQDLSPKRGSRLGDLAEWEANFSREREMERTMDEEVGAMLTLQQAELNELRDRHDAARNELKLKHERLREAMRSRGGSPEPGGANGAVPVRLNSGKGVQPDSPGMSAKIARLQDNALNSLSTTLNLNGAGKTNGALKR